MSGEVPANQAAPTSRVVTPRPIQLTTRTGIEVQRLLPQASLRKISAWCFLDHFGPTAARDAMVVAAHPHTGLQTATWLLDGQVEHRDSIGSIQVLRPGEFNLMTAGRGIAHSELGLESDTVHAVQLWIALPDAVRNLAPSFEHHAGLPKVVGRGFTATVFAGSFHGVTSPATIHWPMLGAQVGIDALEPVPLALNAEFEYGILALTGDLEVNGVSVPAGNLIYLPVGSTVAEIAAHRIGTQALLIGGLAFDERLVMWWNFIGRSHQEIASMRALWNARGSEVPAEVVASHDRFGAVFTDNIGGWIPAPELPNVELRSR